MYDAGYQNIVSVDYSSIVIEQMQAMNEVERPELEWKVADIRQLPFEAASFDVCIDKATMVRIVSFIHPLFAHSSVGCYDDSKT